MSQPTESPRDHLLESERANLDACHADNAQAYVFHWDDWSPGVDAIFLQRRNGAFLAGPLTVDFGWKVCAEQELLTFGPEADR